MRSTRTASSSRTGGNGDKRSPVNDEIRAYDWLRRTIEMLAEGDTPEEFLEHTKLELFQDQVFCFTPKGRLIALPRGATPIDFAYAVHTDIGDTCVGAKINGRIMPLVTELHNGDEVEIIRSEGAGAAGRLGVDRRHRQGALGHPPRDARRRAQAICRPRPPDPRARLRARPGGRIADELLEGGAAAPRPAQHRGHAGRRRARRDPLGQRRCKAVYPDHKDERRRADRAARARKAGSA